MSNTTKTLRDNLFEQMDKLSKGVVTAKEASVTAKISASIIHTIQADIDNKKANIKLMKLLSKKELTKKQSGILPLEI